MYRVKRGPAGDILHVNKSVERREHVITSVEKRESPSYLFIALSRCRINPSPQDKAL